MEQESIRYLNMRTKQLQLRHDLYTKIKAKGVKEVAEDLGVRPNQLSRIFKTLDKEQVERLISLDLLDNLTEYFGLPVGYYYRLYIGELRKRTKMKEDRFTTYFLEEKVKEFIRRCLEIGEYKITEQILFILSKEKSIKVIFEIAEEIFHFAEEIYPYNPATVSYDGIEYQQCLYLYDYVINNGKSFRDYLAISYLRKYYIRRFNSDTVHEDLVLMKHFAKFMPLTEQLEAWERICSYYNMYFKWYELLESAKELQLLAKGINEDKYGYGLLCEGFAYSELEMYSDALKVIEKYENINGFAKHAEINRMIILLKQNNMELSDILIDHCFNYAGQLARQSTLVTVLEKLIENNYIAKAVDLINRCHEEQVYPFDSDKVYLAVKIMRFKRIDGILNLYHLHNIVKGIELVLDAADLAFKINDTKTYGELISIYKNFQGHATEKQLQRGI